MEARADRPPTPDPITDHAVVRYMERVKSTDMRKLRMEILPHERHGLLMTGPGRIECKGYELVCNGGVVVTIIGNRAASSTAQPGARRPIAQGALPWPAPRAPG